VVIGAERWQVLFACAKLAPLIASGKQMTDTILYEQSGHVGRLVLNNASKHNSLGREQLDGIQARLAEIAADKQVRVLVVTGAGDKTFCAGASLQELSAGEIGEDAFQKMTERLADMAIPTICAVNGDVYGGGVELALSCDFRIGVEGCRMRVPAAAIGLCYPLPGIRRFISSLGLNVAKRILVASEQFESGSLLEIGFLDQLVAAENLEQIVIQRAQHIGALAPLAVQSMKSLLQEAAEVQIDPERARKLSELCLESEDLREGFAAKREKRSPRFQGK
jgi:enoyl-CoA hydratase/carnithine racemase